MEAQLTRIEEEIAECKNPQTTGQPTTAEVTTIVSDAILLEGKTQQILQ